MAYSLAAHVFYLSGLLAYWAVAFIFISCLRLSCQSCLYLPGLLLAAAFNYLMTTAQLPVMFVFTWPPAGPAFNYYLVATAWLPP